MRNKDNDRKNMRTVDIPKSVAHATNLLPPKLRLNRLQRLWKLWYTEITSKMLSYGAIQEVALGLFDLVDRLFFERQWILQEVSLGKNVFALYGDLRLPFVMVLSANTFVSQFVEFLPTVFSRYSIKTFREKTQQVEGCRYMKSLEGISPHPMDLWTVLKRCQFHETSESKDKIYSVLGIPSDTENAP